MESASKDPNPGLIYQLALAYRVSAIFFAASELEVFTHLAAGPLTAAELAARCHSALEPTRMMLESCADVGLLERVGDRFKNTPTTDNFLVRGRTAYLGDSLKYARDLYQPWGAITDLVKHGKPTMPPQTILGDDKAKTRAFVMAMHERAKGIGSVLPHNVDLSGRAASDRYRRRTRNLRGGALPANPGPHRDGPGSSGCARGHAGVD